MGAAVLLVFAMAMPTLIGGAVVLIGRMARLLSTRHNERRPAPTVSLERLGTDLRRLHRELDVAETQSRTPAKSVRVRALQGAYLDALADASRMLQVPPPASGLSGHRAQVEIFRVEAALRERGLDVRG